MYEIPYYIENQYLSPPEPETVGFCAECGEDIFAGEDVWEIKNNLFCERCMDSFRTEIYEKEEIDYAI